LIHDLRFETATTKIKLTPDDQYVIASGVLTIKLDMAMFSLICVLLSGCAACLYLFYVLGIYPPQVKVYELKELSMKFERHLISEIVTFQVYSY
jgi:ribosome biogenesis protein ENP2